MHKTVVKPHVVGHEHGTVQQFEQPAGYLFKGRCVFNHGVGDAGQALNKRRNPHARVNQRTPARYLDALFNAHGGDFGDAVVLCVAPGSFQVEHDVAGKHSGPRGAQQNMSASQAGSSNRLMAPYTPNR